jgi:hypothetical protein
LKEMGTVANATGNDHWSEREMWKAAQPQVGF